MQVLQNFTDFSRNSWGKAAHGIDSIDYRIAPPLTGIAHSNDSIANVNFKTTYRIHENLIFIYFLYIIKYKILPFVYNIYYELANKVYCSLFKIRQNIGALNASAATEFQHFWCAVLFFLFICFNLFLLTCRWYGSS